MIRYLYGDQLAAYPTLSSTMFTDRASQFSNRLGWNVTVDAQGYETDEYDALNPLYVIWQQEDGSHGGSMRFLPTTGPVMVNDHFLHLTDGVAITSPLIWECTRFCLSPRGLDTTETSICLMLAAAELGRRFHLEHSVGVFDARMSRLYKALGWEPDVTGTEGTGRGAISVGLWDFKEAPFEIMCARAGLENAEPAAWFNASFQIKEPVPEPA